MGDHLGLQGDVQGGHVDEGSSWPVLQAAAAGTKDCITTLMKGTLESWPAAPYPRRSGLLSYGGGLRREAAWRRQRTWYNAPLERNAAYQRRPKRGVAQK